MTQDQAGQVMSKHVLQQVPVGSNGSTLLLALCQRSGSRSERWVSASLRADAQSIFYLHNLLFVVGRST